MCGTMGGHPQKKDATPKPKKDKASTDQGKGKEKEKVAA